MIHTPDRWLSKAGIASRGEVLGWIRNSRLKLDGRSVRARQPVSSPGSTPRSMILPPFTLDGIRLVPPPPLLLLVNKPRGVLVTNDDPDGRRQIGDLLADTPWANRSFGSIRALGRLDRASAGLILMTNFPELFSSVLDPSSGTLRTYRVQISPFLRERDRQLFLRGEAGHSLGYDRIGVVEERRNSRTGWIRMSLSEGKNREIRNLLSSFGYKVLHLIRISFGPFELLDLPPGGILDVTEEVRNLGVSWIKWNPLPSAGIISGEGVPD